MGLGIPSPSILLAFAQFANTIAILLSPVRIYLLYYNCSSVFCFYAPPGLCPGAVHDSAQASIG